jgi:hypothetical protein
MELKQIKTDRGFDVIEFRDRGNRECTIQGSSLATDNAIWFGINDADPRIMVKGKGFEPVDFPEGTIFNTRMDLSQDQVIALLPILQHFAETGKVELPTTRKTINIFDDTNS